MATWVNRTVDQEPRNGTNSHTFSFTAATAGNLLVAIIEGAVTHTTPSGWTKQLSALANTELAVFTKTATGGENSFTTTHNGSNYPVIGVFYEFLAGSTYVTGAQGNNGTLTSANPNITGLTGTNLTFGAVAFGVWAGIPSGSVAWSGTGSPVEDLDEFVGYSSTDGYLLSIAYVEDNTAASFQPTGTVTAPGFISKEMVTFAVKVNASPPPANISLRAAGTPTSATAAVTAVNPAVPAGATTGDLSVLTVAVKPYNATITTPSGWTKIGEATAGTQVTNLDIGSPKIAMYVKLDAVAGSTTGNIGQSGADSMGAVINTYAVDNGATWDYSSWTGGGDNTSGVNYSATGAAGIDVTYGDWVLVGTAVSSDAGTDSAHVVGGMAGATISAWNDRTSRTITTGNDAKLKHGDVAITGGSSNAPPTFTYNNATNREGVSLFLRLRPVVATGYSGSLDLSGSRTLSISGSPSTPGALAIAGTRTLGPAGSPAPQGTLGLSRTGSLILSGSPTTPGTLALTGTGTTNSYVGIPTHAGTLGLSQSRTINLSGAPNVSASLSVSGTGGVAGQGTPAPVSTVTISGTRTLSMSAAVAIPGTLTLSGSRLLSLAGSTAGFGTLNLSGSRTLNLNGSPSWNVTLGLSGSRVLVQAGAPAFSDTVNLFGIRSLTQGGSPSATGTLGLTGTGSDGYSASPATSGILPLSQFSTLGASGAPNPTENLALDLTRDLQFSGSRDGSGELLLSGTGALDFSGTASIPSALWLAAFSGLAAGGSPAMSDSLGLAASTTLDLSGNLAVSGTLGLEGSGGTGQQGNPAIPGTTTLSGAGLLNLLATALSMASTMNLTGDRVLVLSGVASAEGQGSLNLSGSRVLGFTATPSIFGTLARSGTGVLEAEGAQANAGTLLLEGSRTLTLDAAPAVAGTLALTSAGEFTFDGVVLTEGTLLITGSRTLVLSGQVVGEDTGGMFLKDGTRLHAFMLVGGILIPVTPNFGE